MRRDEAGTRGDRRRRDSRGRRTPEDAAGVDDPGAAGPDGAADPATSLLDRWQAHHDDVAPPPEPDETPQPLEPAEVDALLAMTPQASVSTLADARARREGPPEPEAPLVEPTPLRGKHLASPSSAVEAPAAETPPVAAPPADAPAAEAPAAEEPQPALAPAVASARAARPTLPVVRRPKHAAPRLPGSPADRATDSVEASRDVREALGLVDTAPEVAAEEKPKRVGVEVGPSLNVDFTPRTAARRIIGMLLLVSLAVTAGAAYYAFDDPRPLTLGVAGTMLVVTLVLYGVRAASAVTYVAIRSGQLVVTRGKSIERFDLMSQFTRMEVQGRPGRPGWKVLFARIGRDPFVINSSLVDPKDFTAELERYRPTSTH